MAKQKLAIITGGARGIGLACAEDLAKDGYAIAICSRSEVELEKAAAKISHLGVESVYRAFDVSCESHVRSFVKDLAEKFQPYILVNNAGVQLNRPFLDLSSEDWHKVIGIDLHSCFYFSQAVGKYLVEHKEGRVVNISSVLSQFALPGRCPYSVSKAAMEAMTRVLASEWGELGVTVNGVAPGHIKTELIERDIKKGLIFEDDMCSRSVQGRIGNVDEVSGIVSFLCSPRASYITGQIFFVDGGFSIKK